MKCSRSSGGPFCGDDLGWVVTVTGWQQQGKSGGGESFDGGCKHGYQTLELTR